MVVDLGGDDGFYGQWLQISKITSKGDQFWVRDGERDVEKSSRFEYSLMKKNS